MTDSSQHNPMPPHFKEIQSGKKPLVLDQSPHPNALLYIQFLNVKTAVFFKNSLQNLLPASNVFEILCAPDVLILGAHGELTNAVGWLLRLCTRLVNSSATDDAPSFCSSLMALPRTTEDSEKEALIAALIAARQRAQKPQLLFLDSHCFSALGAGLAEMPGARSCIDPSAPFRDDRRKLSSLLKRPSFFGRDIERDVVARFFEKKETHFVGTKDQNPPKAQLLLLHGAQGIGKSSLIRVALAAASLDDNEAPVLWGAADPAETTPWAALCNMLRALAWAPSGGAKTWSKLSFLVTELSSFLNEEEAKELLRLREVLAFLLGTTSDESEMDIDKEIQNMSARTLRNSLRRSLFLIVKAMIIRGKQHRLVMVISDANFIDTPTRDFLFFLAKQFTDSLRIVFLSSTKMRLPKIFSTHFKVERIELKGLAEKNRLLTAAEIINENPTDLPGLKRLCQRSNGSPLTLLQTMYLAVERGHLIQREGQFSFSELNLRNFPSTATRIIHERLTMLPALQRRILSICAVLGKTFTANATEVVGVCLGLTHEEIQTSLQLLTQTDFLSARKFRPGSPAFNLAKIGSFSQHEENLFSFTHPLIRNATLDYTEKEEKKQIHGEVAAAFISLVPDGISALADKLAHHFDEAAHIKKAIEMFLLAARRANRLEMHSGALHLAQRGLILTSQNNFEHRFQFLREVERAHSSLQDDEQQEKTLESLIDAAVSFNTPKALGQAFQRQARFFIFKGNFEKAVEACIQSLQAFHECDDRQGRAQTLRLLALGRFEQREWDAAAKTLYAAQTLIEPSNRQTLGILEHQMGLLRLETSAPVDALEHLLRAYAHRKSVYDENAAAACLDAMSDVFVRTGRWQFAIEILEKAILLQTRIGDDAARAHSLINLGQVLLLTGDALAATSLAQEARNLSQALHLRRIERSATVLAARAALLLEDDVEAERLINALRRRVAAAEDPFSTMEAALLSGRAKWNRALNAKSTAAKERLLQTALERAKEAAHLGEKHGYATGQMLGNALLGDVFCEMGEPNSALPFSQRAAEMVDDRSSTSLPVEDIHLSYAHVLTCLGDHDEAKTVLNDAMKTLEQLSARLPLAKQELFWSQKSRKKLKVEHQKLNAVQP